MEISLNVAWRDKHRQPEREEKSTVGKYVTGQVPWGRGIGLTLESRFISKVFCGPECFFFFLHVSSKYPFTYSVVMS